MVLDVKRIKSATKLMSTNCPQHSRCQLSLYTKLCYVVCSSSVVPCVIRDLSVLYKLHAFISTRRIEQIMGVSIYEVNTALALLRQTTWRHPTTHYLGHKPSTVVGAELVIYKLQAYLSRKISFLRMGKFKIIGIVTSVL